MDRISRGVGVIMSETKHTPGPWELRNVPGAGLQIWALADLGLDERRQVVQPLYRVDIHPSLKVGDDGKVYVMLSYEDWRQFPTTQFDEMQKANGQLMAAAPDLLKACKAALPCLQDWIRTTAFGSAHDRDLKAVTLIQSAIAKAEVK